MQAAGRKPRLIIDPTISGVNPACFLPERFTLPTLEDLRNAVPLRGCGEEIGGFTLDIAAAHKTVRVRESERGLLGVCIHGRYYFYKVTPFGGAFSALWWQRLAGFLTRVGHRLLWISHVLMIYVDDALLIQAGSVLPFGAALLLGLCQAFGYPLSWKKLQLGPEVVWIGWQLCFRSLAFRLPNSKIVRLLQALHDVLEPASTTVKSLEKLIGILHWVMQMCPQLRPHPPRPHPPTPRGYAFCTSIKTALLRPTFLPACQCGRK